MVLGLFFFLSAQRRESSDASVRAVGSEQVETVTNEIERPTIEGNEALSVRGVASPMPALEEVLERDHGGGWLDFELEIFHDPMED